MLIRFENRPPTVRWGDVEWGQVVHHNDVYALKVIGGDAVILTKAIGLNPGDKWDNWTDDKRVRVVGWLKDMIEDD